uniref:Uncharacterized mitochondrial protein AtMg00860-like n=1 Tax=Nicotiana tabacum TaxID=4097 RepID=A0A1S3YM65_TOBAC|nr:PREDICTED: uncharacterized mitochondrial protein AtMg00860-like [Nicotiana tabacum]
MAAANISALQLKKGVKKHEPMFQAILCIEDMLLPAPVIELLLIDFLRHVIKEGRIKMDQQKIQAITYWPPPNDIHALGAFLGLCNFYWRFMKNYSIFVVPLRELFKKVMPWDWGPMGGEAFNVLKTAMSSSAVLASDSSYKQMPSTLPLPESCYKKGIL